MVCDALLEQPNVKASDGYAVLTTVATVPDDALTTGTLKPGALLHGLVAAVAVIVWTDDSVTIPLDSPPLIWISPDDAETNGMLNPGALLHGLVAAVAVTVGTELRVTMPLDRAVAELRLTVVEPAAPARIVTPRPPDVVTGAIPDEVPTRLNCGVLLMLTAVLAEMVPATTVT